MYKITTVSGNVYTYEAAEGFKLVRCEDDDVLNIYQYSKYDDYYVGMAKYRDKEILAEIKVNRIEAFEILP